MGLKTLLYMLAAILLVDAFFILLPYIVRTVGYVLAVVGLIVLASTLIFILQSVPAHDLYIGSAVAIVGYMAGRLIMKRRRKIFRRRR